MTENLPYSRPSFFELAVIPVGFLALALTVSAGEAAVHDIRANDKVEVQVEPSTTIPTNHN